MTKIECILAQGDYISIDHTQDINGEKCAELNLLESNINTDPVTIIINKYGAEQIIYDLKKRFGI